MIMIRPEGVVVLHYGIGCDRIRSNCVVVRCGCALKQIDVDVNNEDSTERR